MLSRNIFLSTSAMKTFRPWLSCHYALGLLFPGSLGGCGHFPSDPISDPDRNLAVQSDLFSKICHCASQRITGPKSGACVSSPQEGNHLHCL